MSFVINAACLCDKGKIRSNNEDNFYFNGTILPAENDALPSPLTCSLPQGSKSCFAVFDGMGGEQYGEAAAYAAARCLKERLLAGDGATLGEEERLEKLTLSMNAAVERKAKEFLTRHMGATLAGLLFSNDRACAFNLGDSRVYLLRAGVLHQLSEDHVEKRPFQAARRTKPSLTQHLGIDEEEFVVEPTVSCSPAVHGDRYLLCSDGLTDMLTDEEICELLSVASDTAAAVRSLVAAALDRGGKDNVTVIVCELS